MCVHTRIEQIMIGQTATELLLFFYVPKAVAVENAVISLSRQRYISVYIEKLSLTQRDYKFRPFLAILYD